MARKRKGRKVDDQQPPVPPTPLVPPVPPVPSIPPVAPEPSIPTDMNEKVLALKEVLGGDFPDDAIRAALQECQMDSNEAFERLHSQDKFHEVKRKGPGRKQLKEAQGSDASGPFSFFIGEVAITVESNVEPTPAHGSLSAGSESSNIDIPAAALNLEQLTLGQEEKEASSKDNSTAVLLECAQARESDDIPLDHLSSETKNHDVNTDIPRDLSSPMPAAEIPLFRDIHPFQSKLNLDFSTSAPPKVLSPKLTEANELAMLQQIQHRFNSRRSLTAPGYAHYKKQPQGRSHASYKPRFWGNLSYYSTYQQGVIDNRYLHIQWQYQLLDTHHQGTSEQAVDQPLLPPQGRRFQTFQSQTQLLSQSHADVSHSSRYLNLQGQSDQLSQGTAARFPTNSMITAEPLRWRPPNGDTVKTNVGACWRSFGLPSGAGIIVRNGQGEVLLSAGIPLTSCDTALLAVLKALGAAVDVISDASFRDVILELDCLPLVRGLKSKKCPFGVDDSVLFDDVVARCCKFRSVDFEHVKRTCNSAAYELARWACFLKSPSILIEEVPPFLNTIVNRECSSLSG